MFVEGLNIPQGTECFEIFGLAEPQIMEDCTLHITPLGPTAFGINTRIQYRALSQSNTCTLLGADSH